MKRCCIACFNVAGDKAIDDHLFPSQLGGETGDAINRFRQARYREYIEICRLCQERSIRLSEKLLKKGLNPTEYQSFQQLQLLHYVLVALLYPADRPSQDIQKNIRVPVGPGGGLFSSKFAEKPKEPSEASSTPVEDRSRQVSKKVRIEAMRHIRILGSFDAS